MAELTDADVGLAPARGAAPVELTDAEVFGAPAPAGPISAQFGGAPLTEPQMDPAVAATPTIADRFRINAREGFDSTLAGEVVNRFESGQVAQTAADDMFRAITDARNSKSGVALPSFYPTEDEQRRRAANPMLRTAGRPNPYAGMPLDQLEIQFNEASQEAARRADVFGAQREVERAEYKALPSFTQADTLSDKVIQGATAFAGELAGGFASPENLIGGPGRRAATAVGDNIVSRIGREVTPGVVAGAAGGAAADPVVQSGRVERGEQEGFEAGQLAASVLLGGAVGGAFQLPGAVGRAVMDRIAARRGVAVDKLDPASVSPTEAADAIADPQVAALAKANGIDTATDPRVAQLVALVEKRRSEEALRTSDNPTGSMRSQDAEVLRRQNEVQGVADGAIDPAATNIQRRAPDETTIRVDKQGGAFREEPGTMEGRAKADILGGADQKALPAPGRAVLTDEEISLQRKQAGVSDAPGISKEITPEPPPKLYGQEDRAPQMSDNLVEQRQAGDAFDLAQRQRERAAPDVRDTQVAGRPSGLDDNLSVMVDGEQPVRLKGTNGDKLVVEPYDPRTGQPSGEAYTVKPTALQEVSYARQPRQAQDFVDRAQGPRPSEQPRGPADPVRRQPEQTYRADQGPVPPAKPDTSPPAQPLNGPADVAPRSAAGDAPAAATVRGSYEAAVRAETDRLWAEDMPGYKRGKSDNESAVTDSARETVMRREVADAAARADEAGVPGDVMHEVARLYRRADGETPQQAFERATSRWVDQREADATSYDNLFDEADRNFDPLKAEGSGPIADMYERLENHYTGGKVDHDAIPFDEPRGPASQEGGEAPNAGRAGSDQVGRKPGGRSEDVGSSRSTDAGPDGKRQEVIPGAERITDRALAERQGSKPLKGGNEPPPKGGLFDEDARNQGDIFDPRNTMHAGAIFDPQVWKWMGKSLGFNEQYRREMGGLVEDFRKAKSDERGHKTSKTGDMARLVFYSTDGALRALGHHYGDSPTIKKIADMLFAPADVGRGGAVSRTFSEQVAVQSGRNLNEVAKVMEPFAGKKDVIDQIVRLVQNPNRIRPGAAIHDAAKALSKLLDDEHAAAKKAGIDVGYVKGYYPREVDVAKAIANPAGFRTKAESAYRAAGLAGKEAKEAANHWFERIALGGVNVRADGTDFVHLGGTPTRDFSKGRVLTKAADEIMAPFYHRDPLEALTIHFQRTARRAAWAERFGDDLGEWKEMKEALIKEGNAAAIPEVVRAIASSTGANPVSLPRSMSSAIGWIRTHGVLRLLPRATITSLSEVLLPSIRAGSPGRALGDIVQTTRALWKRSGDLGEQRDFAEDLGLIMRGSENGLLAARFNATDPTNRVQERVMNRFFRATGLEQWTSATRVTAVNAAETFIRRLALDVAGGKGRAASAKSLLTELGVQDVAGFSKWVDANKDTAKGRDAFEGGHADTYRDAVVRFVGQAIQAPTASTRPRWANHPLGSLIFMLQSYGYAFQKNVINRAGHSIVQAATNKDYSMADRARVLAPIGMLPALMAIQMGVTPMREAVFGSSGKDAKDKKEQETKNMLTAFSRSGLTGALDPLFNIYTGAKYNRDVATGVAGPNLGSVGQLLDTALKMAPKAYGGQNSDNTNSAERSAVRGVYDMAVAPAVILGASLLPAPIGAPLAQVPGLVKDEVIDAVAGPKKAAGATGRPSRPSRK